MLLSARLLPTLSLPFSTRSLLALRGIRLLLKPLPPLRHSRLTLLGRRLPVPLRLALRDPSFALLLRGGIHALPFFTLRLLTLHLLALRTLGALLRGAPTLRRGLLPLRPMLCCGCALAPLALRLPLTSLTPGKLGALQCLASITLYRLSAVRAPRELPLLATISLLVMLHSIQSFLPPLGNLPSTIISGGNPVRPALRVRQLALLALNATILFAQEGDRAPLAGTVTLRLWPRQYRPLDASGPLLAIKGRSLPAIGRLPPVLEAAARLVTRLTLLAPAALALAFARAGPFAPFLSALARLRPAALVRHDGRAMSFPQRCSDAMA